LFFDLPRPTLISHSPTLRSQFLLSIAFWDVASFKSTISVGYWWGVQVGGRQGVLSWNSNCFDPPPTALSLILPHPLHQAHPLVRHHGKLNLRPSQGIWYSSFSIRPLTLIPPPAPSLYCSFSIKLLPLTAPFLNCFHIDTCFVLAVSLGVIFASYPAWS